MGLAQFSPYPVFIEVFFNDTYLASGTGFFIKSNDSDETYLVTARHNFTGRDFFTEKCLSKNLSIPNRAKLHYWKINSEDKSSNTFNIGNERIVKEISLRDPNDSPKWYVSKTTKADIAVLKFEQEEGLFIFDPKQHDTPIYLTPTQSVSIIGFPFGKSVSGLGIWASGYIASDVDIDYDNLPVFLVDSRSREGQSGSPVIVFKTEIFKAEDGTLNTPKNISVSRFLGIYTGRINKDSDLGFVWKPKFIYSILANNVKEDKADAPI